MNETRLTVRRALLSVSDKTGIVPLARGLQMQGVEILSTGGTAALLREHDIAVTDVASVTQFPEIMDGRVKTLHPKIHGGILGLRDQHAETAAEHEINWIDLVVVNLYPFRETVADPAVTPDLAVENVDIGGPAMIRSAAKNMGWAGVVVDPADYTKILDELHQGLAFATRKQLAQKAFAHTAEYDALIARYLAGICAGVRQEKKSVVLQKINDLRYGENPHQPASVWRYAEDPVGIPAARQHQGKPLSWNNLVDADAAFACVREFADPACVIVKHATPCGVATDRVAEQVFSRALAADPLSAFGGIVALNTVCNLEMAEAIAAVFVEVVLAKSFTAEALACLARKPDLRVLEVDFSAELPQEELKFIQGGLLVQARDVFAPDEGQFRIVSQKQPLPDELEAARFAFQVVKHVKSNAIVLARDFVTVGIGGGQVSRVDAVEVALRKAGKRAAGAVLASDAFFPFRDSIDLLEGSGVAGIIQPGGSRRDAEVIAACDAHGMFMIMTGVRCFRH